MSFTTSKQLGIDLGTSITSVYLKDSGIIMRAPSVIAVDKQSGEVLAVGSEAKRMLGKTPSSIIVHRPLHGGVVSDYDISAKMLKVFFDKIKAGSLFSRPTIYICVPYGVTEVERRAVIDATYDAGAKEVFPIEEPIAAAIGSGLRVESPRGCMIVNIGGGSTEAAVISLFGIVVSNSARVAGDNFDFAIVKYLKENKGILIGETTAEMLKIQIGSVHKNTDKGQMQVFGRSVETGQATSAVVKSSDIRAALAEQIETVITIIKSTLEDAPPELSSDIYDFGMMLTGGSALLPGLVPLIIERTGLKVTVAKNPLDSVCLGIGRVMQAPESYRASVINQKQGG